MIDLHGNRDWWSCNSPIGYYMEHLPYEFAHLIWPTLSF